MYMFCCATPFVLSLLQRSPSAFSLTLSHLYVPLLQLLYLQDYVSKLALHIQYNTEILQVGRQGDLYQLTDQNGLSYYCHVLIVW